MAVGSSSRTKNTQHPEPIFEGMADMPVSPIAKAPNRTQRAQDYEEKVTGILSVAMKATAQNESTIPDAAAIITHGPAFASKLGDLADHDPRVRKAVDFITQGTDNPYAALMVATIPFVAQVIRNHETTAPVKVGIRIPFTKRTLRVPFNLKLRNPFLRSVTHAPKDISTAVFDNPAIRASLLSQRIDVAWPGYHNTVDDSE